MLHGLIGVLGVRANKNGPKGPLFLDSAEDEIRTRDLLLGKEEAGGRLKCRIAVRSRYLGEARGTPRQQMAILAVICLSDNGLFLGQPPVSGMPRYSP